MKNTIYTLSGLLFLCCSACTQTTTPVMTADQVALVKDVKEMSPSAESQKNIANNFVVFFAIGSSSYGYNVSGLSQQEVHEYVDVQKVPVVLKFSDDPAPIDATNAYWEEAEKFVSAYNKIMLAYLKETKSKQ